MTGGATAIYSIHWLLTNYGKDPIATEILDTRAFAIRTPIPRTRRPWGLDFNRNGPAFWNPEGKWAGCPRM